MYHPPQGQNKSMLDIAIDILSGLAALVCSLFIAPLVANWTRDIAISTLMDLLAIEQTYQEYVGYGWFVICFALVTVILFIIFIVLLKKGIYRLLLGKAAV